MNSPRAADPERDEGLPIARYEADAALLARTLADGRPRARIYRPPCCQVVLGAGSRPHLELDLVSCLADQVPLLRRPGGGCAVVLDPGNLIVSLIFPDDQLPGIRSSFDVISTVLIEVLAAAGIPGLSQRGVSDLTLGDRKVGGSCIYKPRGALYYSTTLLQRADLALIDRYLRHPPREPDYRAGRPHRAFVQNLGQLDESRVAAHLQAARFFSSRLEIELAPET